MGFTTGLMLRTYRGDIPYLNQYLEYHLDHLKFDRVFLISSDDTAWDEVLDSSFLPKIKVLRKKLREDYTMIDKYIEKGRFQEEIKKSLDFDGVDYLIQLDSDEFLYFDGLTVQEHLSKYQQYNQLVYPWLICVADEFQKRSVFDRINFTQMRPAGWLNEQLGKVLFRAKDMIYLDHSGHGVYGKTRSKDQARHYFKPDFLDGKGPKMAILHFTSRSYLDPFIRAALGKDRPGDQLEMTVKLLANPRPYFDDLPMRVMKFLIDREKKFDYNVNENFDFPTLKHAIDLEKEVELFKEILNELPSEDWNKETIVERVNNILQIEIDERYFKK
jgi:hypothetical protein